MLVAIRHGKLDEHEARDAVSRAQNGAVLVFHGVVRDQHEGRAVTHIVYHAYEVMALQEMSRLAAECGERFGVFDIALLHRVGTVPVGEASLLLAVAHAHRGPTFAAGLWLIDELKRRVPIWKHEFGPDGASWVEGVLPEVSKETPGLGRSSGVADPRPESGTDPLGSRGATP